MKKSTITGETVPLDELPLDLAIIVMAFVASGNTVPSTSMLYVTHSIFCNVMPSSSVLFITTRTPLIVIVWKIHRELLD